jgi:hypothetical protein
LEVELEPDVLFTIEYFTCATVPGCTTVKEYSSEIPLSGTRSFSHRMVCVYVASGHGVQSGDGESMSSRDIAPTLLFAISPPIPMAMDGDSMNSVFEKDFRERHRVTRKHLSEHVERSNDGSKAVQEQPEDVGYV